MPDWYNLLPRDIADEQTAWERRQRIYRAVEAGAELSDIARNLGMSRGLAYLLLRRAMDDRPRPSPVECMLSEER